MSVEVGVRVTVGGVVTVAVGVNAAVAVAVGEGTSAVFVGVWACVTARFCEVGVVVKVREGF